MRENKKTHVVKHIEKDDDDVVVVVVVVTPLNLIFCLQR